MSLPERYIITTIDPLKIDLFYNMFNKHIICGKKLIQLRAKKLSRVVYKEIAKNAIELAHAYQSILLLNTDIEMACQLDSDGVHLSSDILMELRERPLAANKLISAACHNEEQLMQATKVGVDFVTLSPVLSTASHIDAEPIGWELFSALCKLVDIPVYALGGMSEQDLFTAQSHGAKGIAGIRGLWEDKAFHKVTKNR